MKLHDPDIEREVTRLATLGRKGKEMEPADPGRSWSTIVIAPFMLAALLSIPAGALGLHDPRLRTEHWQTLIICILMMWTSQLSLNILIGRFMKDGYNAVCANLPIRGEHAFRWVRSRFFAGRWFAMLLISSLCGFAIHGFSLEHPWHLAATTLLLFVTGFATTILLNIEQFKIVRIWTAGSILLMGWMFLLYVTDARIFRTEETPQWMVEAILKLTWLIPPSWCLPGRFENGGAILTLLWAGVGLARWKAWPRAAAPYLDARRDFAESFGHFAFSEDEEEENHPAYPVHEAPDERHHRDAGEVPTSKGLPPPPALPGGTLVDRWVRRWIAKGDEVVAGAFSDDAVGRTFRTKWTLLILPLWLLLVWLFVRFVPEPNWKDTGTIWIWLLSVLIPLGGLLPFSTSVSNAHATWSLGTLNFPIFSALPVSTRSLLRISTRITFARCVLMMLIAAPYACILIAILLPDVPPLVGLWLVPAFCFFWVTARPQLVWYRLQEANRRKRGAGTLVIHVILVLLNLLLGVTSVLAATLGTMAGLAYFGKAVSGEDLWLLPLAAVGGLLLSAVCSRAVFEIYHWQLRRRLVDWITSR